MENPDTPQNSTPRTLILGKSGMLAHALARVFEKQQLAYDTLGRPEFDILRDDPETLDLTPYAYVINAIGLTNRWEQTAPATSFRRINTEFPQQMAAICQRADRQFIHISTDCVFSGAQGPYSEESHCDASSLYGRSKIEGEPADSALVIRTSIIGPEIKNNYSLLSWLLENRGGKINGYTNHLWNGVTTDELAQFIARFVKQGSQAKGIRHITSPEVVTKAGLILMLLEALGDSDTKVSEIEADESIDRRLSTIYPEFLKSCKIRPLKQQISAMVAQIKVEQP